MISYGWMFLSVILVSIAQLILKWAIVHLPPLITFQLWLCKANEKALVLLMSSLIAYICSVICWFMVLRRLPMNKAYPMLSFSYILVAIFTTIIPEFNEQFTFSRSIGIMLIFIGLLLIYLPANNSYRLRIRNYWNKVKLPVVCII